MSLKPEDYPGEHPEEWYETYVGTMVGHISLLRDMLSGDLSWMPNDWDRPEVLIPRVHFSIGSWEDGIWVDGISGGSGMPLRLSEDSEAPSLLLGDFKLYDQLLEDPDEGFMVVETADLIEFPLDRMGFIFGVSASAEHWEETDN